MKGTGLTHPFDIISSPDYVGHGVLASSVGQAFDTPTGAGFVVFSSNVDFFVRYGSTAASVPTTSSTGSSTNAELNPTTRNIGSTAACTGISVISANAGIVTMSWFAH